MSKDTWNFQCHQPQDDGPDNPPRNSTGTLFSVGPTATQPFTDEITSVFSFLVRSGWTSQDDAGQGLFSIGVAGGHESVGYYFGQSGSTPNMIFYIRNGSTGTMRYNIRIGDEDGINWLQDDKWYQFAISANSSRIQLACNGTTSPKTTVITNSPGSLNMNVIQDRIWMTSPSASIGTASDPIALTTLWPSVVLGPAMHRTTAIDLTDSAVLGRIFDGNGDFKSPGENGSLWLGDTYGDVIPEYYFPTGVPYHNLGSDTQLWKTWDGGAPSTKTPIGGLRKQFE